VVCIHGLESSFNCSINTVFIDYILYSNDQQYENVNSRSGFYNQVQQIIKTTKSTESRGWQKKEWREYILSKIDKTQNAPPEEWEKFMSDTIDEDWERYLLDAMDAAAEEEEIMGDNASDASEVIEKWEVEDDEHLANIIKYVCQSCYLWYCFDMVTYLI
jgi:hypothetical protein